MIGESPNNFLCLLVDSFGWSIGFQMVCCWLCYFCSQTLKRIFQTLLVEIWSLSVTITKEGSWILLVFSINCFEVVGASGLVLKGIIRIIFNCWSTATNILRFPIFVIGGDFIKSMVMCVNFSLGFKWLLESDWFVKTCHLLSTNVTGGHVLIDSISHYPSILFKNDFVFSLSFPHAETRGSTMGIMKNAVSKDTFWNNLLQL